VRRVRVPEVLATYNPLPDYVNITLQFDVAMDTAVTPDPTDFDVTVDGSPDNAVTADWLPGGTDLDLLVPGYVSAPAEISVSLPSAVLTLRTAGGLLVDAFDPVTADVVVI